MNSKTINIPSISCGHCTNTIETELRELNGVASVQADVESKQVTVEWGDPATWGTILDLLVEIDFAPEEA